MKKLHNGLALSERMRIEGFTLIELLLVISIVAVLGSIAVPTIGNYLARNNFIDSQNDLVGAFRTAQLNTLTNKNNGPWGVQVTSTAFTLFQGSTFAGRIAVFDQINSIPTIVTVTGVGLTIPVDIIFSHLTGVPNQTGTIRFTGNTGEIVNIGIGASGVVTVN